MFRRSLVFQIQSEIINHNIKCILKFRFMLGSFKTGLSNCAHLHKLFLYIFMNGLMSRQYFQNQETFHISNSSLSKNKSQMKKRAKMFVKKRLPFCYGEYK